MAAALSLGLFATTRGPVPVADVWAFLEANHYLGGASRGFAWSDDLGVLVLSAPTSRRLPKQWLELTRWCLVGTKNGGSMQWARVVPWIRDTMPEVTTVVSYSDPAVGHTGALYRACNWLWSPTWHRLRPPPSGNGAWKKSTAQESVKDRWIFPLIRDDERPRILELRDASLEKRFPYALYREPRFRRDGTAVPGSGGGDFKQWRATQAPGAAGGSDGKR